MPGSRVAPSACTAKLLEDEGLIDEAAHAAMDAEIAAEIDDAVAFAQQSPFPGARGAQPAHVSPDRSRA